MKHLQIIGQITGRSLTKSFILAIALLAIEKISALGFTDTSRHWNAQCINQLAEKKLVSGYPDRTFRPDATVTRAEFAVLMLNAFPDAKIQRSSLMFSDIVNSYWAYNAINLAVQKAFFVGYPDRTFRPNQAIPRTQAILVIANALGAEPVTNTETILTQYFDDAAAIPDYAKGAIAAAVKKSFSGKLSSTSTTAPQSKFNSWRSGGFIMSGAEFF